MRFPLQGLTPTTSTAMKGQSRVQAGGRRGGSARRGRPPLRRHSLTLGRSPLTSPTGGGRGEGGSRRAMNTSPPTGNQRLPDLAADRRHGPASPRALTPKASLTVCKTLKQETLPQKVAHEQRLLLVERCYVSWGGRGRTLTARFSLVESTLKQAGGPLSRTSVTSQPPAHVLQGRGPAERRSQRGKRTRSRRQPRSPTTAER